MSAGYPPTEPMDPGRDYLLSFREAFDAEFGWEASRAHELAVFHTFAAPSISKVLDQTGEFEHRGQKRYDDTTALLREPVRHDPRSRRGREAIRHMNQIHRPYGISNDDYLYVLATFVVIPVRWIGRYGWRDLTENEISAVVRYYQELGLLMGIRQIPPTYAAFASYLDAYEREHHYFSEANRRLAQSLINVFESWLPPLLRPLTRGCIAAALGQSLRHALGLPEPSGLIRAVVHVTLRSRAVLIRLLPPLRRIRKAPRQLRSYPCGYTLTDLGPARTPDEDPTPRYAAAQPPAAPDSDLCPRPKKDRADPAIPSSQSRP